MIRFEWDPAKARTNLGKHGVSFEDAMYVFEDPWALFEQDRVDEETGEPRWQAIGEAGGTVVLLVAHTAPEVRIISARMATRKERIRYEQSRA